MGSSEDNEMRVHTIGVQANIPETRYTKIARGVQHRRAQKTDFAILGALTNRRLRRDRHLVLTVRNRDDIRRLLSGATNQHGSLTNQNHLTLIMPQLSGPDGISVIRSSRHMSVECTFESAWKRVRVDPVLYALFWSGKSV